MNFDALTLGAVRDELRATILGGKIQHVHLPDDLGLAIEVYAQGRSRWLYCSAHPQRARVHLVGERPPRTADEVMPLLLLLRKYVDGGRVDDIEQPPLERILRIGCSRRAPDGQVWRTTLVVEVMGRHSNVILLDEDGTIMDAAKRVPAQINRVRTVLPRLRYDPPPAQQKLDPRTLVPATLAQAAAGPPPPRSLREALVATVDACSPLLAREVAFRVAGSVDAPAEGADWTAVCDAFGELWRDAGAGRWAPTVAEDGGRIVAYAPYPLRSFGQALPAPGISAAVERWHRERSAAPAPGADAARKAGLRQALAAAQDRLRAKRYSLGRSLVDEAEVIRLRRAGEHLLTVATQVAPGQTEVALPDGTAVALRPELTAVENARAYFARYEKTKSAAAEVPAMIDQVEHELRYLEEALTHLELATSPAELNDLRAEWGEAGYVRAQPGRMKNEERRRGNGGARAGKKGKGTGGGKGGRGKKGTAGGTGVRRVMVEGFEVLIGRSGRGNDALLTRESHPADTWLHARGVPGAHVLVRSGGRSVPETVLHRAAALAASHSQARLAPSVGVDYTLRKYVERIKGAPPGLASYRGERTLYVAPATDV